MYFKEPRALLVTVKSLNWLFTNRSKEKHKLGKGAGKDGMRTLFFQSDIYDSFEPVLLIIIHKYLDCTLAML